MAIDLARARENMIEQQIRPWEVLDPRVLAAFRAVPRDRYVPAAYRDVAYGDLAIPLGDGEHMMKPVLEGRLLQALALDGGERVLEIGTGSGYLTACLSQLARAVVSVERRPDLVEAARRRLTAEGIAPVLVETADALAGFQPEGVFDAIAVTGAVEVLPERLLAWLAPGGRLFAVRGREPAMEAVLATRVDAGHVHVESLFETDLAYLHGAAPRPAFSF